VSLVATHDNIDKFDESIDNALDHLARRVVLTASRLRDTDM
jgi:NAD(P)H dehydrogenase (quinone)